MNGDARALQRFLEHEGDLGLDPGLDERLHRNGGVLEVEEVLEEVSVVGLLDAQESLHRGARQPHLVALDDATLLQAPIDLTQLDGVGIVQSDVGEPLRQGIDGCACRVGLSQFASHLVTCRGVHAGGLLGVDGEIEGASPKGNQSSGSARMFRRMHLCQSAASLCFDQRMRSTERDDRGTAPTSVLGRAALVMAAFDDNARTLGVSALSNLTGLPKSTTHRLVSELTELRILDREPDGSSYRLGRWLFELGEMVPMYRSLSEAALPVMEDLRDATHQRVHLAVLNGVDVVYVAILGSGRAHVSSRIGGRLPSHATGVGKALLAHSPSEVLARRIEAGLPALTPRTIVSPGRLGREMAKIRTEGMAYDREESHLGISCVAAPVFGLDGHVAAAISVTGSTTSMKPARFGVAARTAALTLTRQLRQSGL
jgi:IclR family transcriptional regulator, acetate operon repressor